MKNIRKASVFGAYALGIIAIIPAPVGERLLGIAGFVLLWAVASRVLTNRILSFGLAAVVPWVLWGIAVPSLARWVAVVLAACFSAALWWAHEIPRRWGWALGAVVVTVGTGQAWQGVLGYDLLRFWKPLSGLGALTIVSAYLIGERQRLLSEGLILLARRLAHDVSTPLHVVRFCAQQWQAGAATDRHREQLVNSSERAKIAVERGRAALAAWTSGDSVPFELVWEWVSHGIEGSERIQCEPGLANESWPRNVLEPGCRELRAHVTELCRRYPNDKIYVETGSRPPNLRFLLNQEVANSAESREGEVCKSKRLVSEWRL